MSVAEIGAMIPIVALIIPIVALTTRHKRKMAELEVRKLEALAASGKGAGNDRTEWLEDRVKVLERIVTDKGTNLADEIEALRDRPQIAPRRPERSDEA
ncbi:hypothetical protein [Novosphingobium sp. B 225]|uniref:hypothetical protein n=1 Tax=Novosphingobium sp. B 225 TaxID=1961849 RepID=UPI0020CE3FB7|nr:hypothetical protein [Novosphingobium sp. B 225]